jgi:hypothetical protein
MSTTPVHGPRTKFKPYVVINLFVTVLWQPEPEGHVNYVMRLLLMEASIDTIE